MTVSSEQSPLSYLRPNVMHDSPATGTMSASANLCESLWSAARARASHAAIVERDRTWSYASLRSRAAAIAVALDAHGVVADDRVAIFLDRGGDAAASIFAIHAIGAIGVVISERFRPRQIEYVVRHAGASVLLTSGDILSRQPRALDIEASIVDVASMERQGAFTPVSRGEADIAQILYTSGSTGMPKGVAFTHGALRAGVAAVSGYLGLTDDDRIASLLPFSSVYGLNQLLCCVAVTASLVIESSPLPLHIVERLRTDRVSVVAGVPPLWLQLLAVPSFTTEPIPSLRIIQNAGGHCPREAVRKLREAQPRAAIFLQYGMTETFRSTYLPPEEVDRRPDSMGKAMPGVEILVIDEEGRACAPGEIGELVHNGPTIAAGYWGDPNATARVFRPHPFASADSHAARVVYSGDMVRRDEAGFLYFVSRRDRLIKTLGFRVGPDEVVDVLFASGQISEAAITTEPDAQRGERIIAYVVLGATGSQAALQLFCRTELPRHMQPARIEWRQSLARLPSGKYDLDAIRGEAVGG
jgi:acyl-CoA synthetase (AMP-forming)/AMP-acid ligase II